MASHAIVYMDTDAAERQSLEHVMQETWANPLLTFATGEDLIRYLRSLPREQLPQVVVLDLDQPGETTSYELVRWIRQQYGERHAPVTVVVTGEKDRDAVLAAKEAGAKYYVLKPVEPASLFAIIRREPSLSNQLMRFVPAT